MSCNCGVSYVAKSVRAAEAIKAAPEKSDRAIAAEIGVSRATVQQARGAEQVANYEPPERVGRDGKSYSIRQRVADDQIQPTIGTTIGLLALPSPIPSPLRSVLPSHTNGTAIGCVPSPHTPRSDRSARYGLDGLRSLRSEEEGQGERGQSDRTCVKHGISSCMNSSCATCAESRHRFVSSAVNASHPRTDGSELGSGAMRIHLQVTDHAEIERQVSTGLYLRCAL